MKKDREKKLSSAELASFCSQMAAVLKAGISPGEGVAIMLEDTDSPQERGNPLCHTGNSEYHRSFQHGTGRRRGVSGIYA